MQSDINEKYIYKKIKKCLVIKHNNRYKLVPIIRSLKYTIWAISIAKVDIVAVLYSDEFNKLSKYKLRMFQHFNSIERLEDAIKDTTSSIEYIGTPNIPNTMKSKHIDYLKEDEFKVLLTTNFGTISEIVDYVVTNRNSFKFNGNTFISNIITLKYKYKELDISGSTELAKILNGKVKTTKDNIFRNFRSINPRKVTSKSKKKSLNRDQKIALLSSTISEYNHKYVDTLNY